MINDLKNHKWDTSEYIEDTGRVGLQMRNQWQPIETAPKDGTQILGNHNSEIYIMLYDADKNYHDEVVEWCNEKYWTSYGDDTYRSYYPTHWQTLPEPPTNETKETNNAT